MVSQNAASSVLDRLSVRSTRNAETGCVTWDGARLKGYGMILVEGSARRVHNVAWRAWNGPIPEGMELDHLCHTQSECDRGDDCPHRACWNPDHLEPVTHAVNVLRGDSPSAKNARKTHCIRNHELAGANLYRAPNGRRVCRACRALWLANRRASRAERNS